MTYCHDKEQHDRSTEALREDLAHSNKKLADALLQVGALQKQLRTAQEVINKHATDGIEGLHCVDCVAEEDEMCDCPMLVPFWEAMKGFEEKK